MDELLRIQLDDELLLHGQVDLLARRQRCDPAAHAVRVERQPFGDAAAFHFFDRVQNRRRRFARLAHADDLADAHRVRRHVDLLAVHEEVAVAHELARLRSRRREPEPVDDVVEPALEQLQQRLAGDAALTFGRLEVAAELILEHTVDALHLLLFAQLDAVAHELGLSRLPVLSGWEVALLDRALLRVAALSLEEELHSLSPAEPAHWTYISRHYTRLLL